MLSFTIHIVWLNKLETIKNCKEKNPCNINLIEFNSYHLQTERERERERERGEGVNIFIVFFIISQNVSDFDNNSNVIVSFMPNSPPNETNSDV